ARSMMILGSRRRVRGEAPRSSPHRKACSMPAPRRRSVTGASDASAHRLNVRISEEASRRLAVHALMAGVTPGRLLAQLISDHLKPWRVQAVQANRSVNVPVDGRLEIAGDVNPAEATAA